MTTVSLRGTGRVELPAYGLADAEHRVHKVLAAIWRGCRVDVMDVGRVDSRARVVEEFAVGYRVRGSVETSAADPRAAAVRELRTRFAGTRFERITLEVVE